MKDPSEKLIDQLISSQATKIVIWGPPTSGKSLTTFLISKQLGIKTIVYSDDYLSWSPSNGWQYMDKSLFLQKVDPLIKNNKSWIVEGNLGEYISRKEMFGKADKIIILNPSYLRLFYRIFTRTISRNTRFKLGTQTTENAIILHKFTAKDLFFEVVDMIKTVINFKQSFIFDLLNLAGNKHEKSKFIIVN